MPFSPGSLFVRQPLEAAVAAGRAFRLELQNHDPREKRQRSASEAARLAAAEGPPASPRAALAPIA